ncbi:MAG: hypothetical protein GY867_11025 [bacterium]|nr:hypothetical protein [bacterium]
MRKLLLWTAVIGLYLRIARCLDLDLATGAMLTAFVAVIIVLRSTVGWQATAVASLAGCAMGPLLCGIVELTIREVDWADNLMQGTAAVT